MRLDIFLGLGLVIKINKRTRLVTSDERFQTVYNNTHQQIIHNKTRIMYYGSTVGIID